MKSRIIWPFLALLTAAGIFVSSSIPGDDSGYASMAIAAWIQNIIPISGSALNFLVRKTAHFIVFFTLGFFTAHSLKFYGRRRLPMFALAWGIAAMYGIADEIHQSFVPGRFCSVPDMALNAAGALAGVGLVFLTARRGAVYSQ